MTARHWLMFWACALGFHQWELTRRGTMFRPERWKCTWCGKDHTVKW